MIDQKPVRHQFFLNSSVNEQKESAYGWVNIEDQDLALAEGEKVVNISLNSRKI